MHLILFSIFAICIAEIRTQDIAIGNEYVPVNHNDSSLSELAIHAQITEILTPPPVVVSTISPVTSGTDGTHTTLKEHLDSSEQVDDHEHRQSDHHHHSHHEYDAKISIDVNNIINLFKQQLHQSEERIIAAIQHSVPSGQVATFKSYRTADR